MVFNKIKSECHLGVHYPWLVLVTVCVRRGSCWTRISCVSRPWLVLTSDEASLCTQLTQLWTETLLGHALSPTAAWPRAVVVRTAHKCACIWARLRACVTWGLLSCSSSPEAQVLFRRGPLRERCVFVTAASLWHGVVGSHAPDWTCLCLRLPGIPAGSCRGSQPSLQPGRQGTDAPLAVTTRSLCCTRPGGSVGTELMRLCSDRALQLHGRARVPDEPQVLRGGLPDPR